MINVLEMLENTAIRFSDKTAFADPFDSITFNELSGLSQKIATLFLKGIKTAPLRMEMPVAFYLEKSVKAMPAVFGTVYAGGFYCFIDIRQPKERVKKILEVLDPAIIITDQHNIENLSDIIDGEEALYKKVILLSELIEAAENETKDEQLLCRARNAFYDQMPLYVNFTSGSTGTPKGVLVGHRSVIDFITEFTSVFDINETDTLANQAPFDFDVSVKDVYSGLFTGAKVQLIPRDYFSSPVVLMDYLTDNEVTVLIWAVSAMCFVSIMNGLEYRTPEKIRKVMFSGELMPVKQLNKWRKYLPSAEFVNLYGPTEITCNCTYYIIDREFEKDEIIPIGIPFRNEKVFLLDEDKPVNKPGEKGEICVGGTALAIGYYKDTEKTAEVFVQNPLNNRYYERIYRTGDLGAYDEDGNLVYYSRKDFQIKHLGQRIELMDIEVSAMAVEGVERACALYDMKRKKIILFYEGDIEKDELSESLHGKLPSFMLPGKTIRLHKLPLNKNGKIDRKALEEYV